MSLEVNNSHSHDNMTEGTSTMIEIPETKTTFTSETENITTNVKDEKLNQGQNQNLDRELNMSNNEARTPMTKAKLILVLIGYINLV